MKIIIALFVFLNFQAFADTVLATGTVESKKTQRVLMPLVPSFNGKLSEMVDEGTSVEVGDLLIRIDGTDVNSKIESLEEQLTTFEATSKKTEIDLLIQLNTAQISFDRADTNLKIAKMKAEVPLNYIGELAFKQNQLSQKTAEKVFQKTVNDLNEVKKKQKEARSEKKLGIAQKQKKLSFQKDLLSNYTVYAERTGYVVNATHPWNGSKIQLGDQLQSGWPVLTVSENSDLQISAWINAIDIPHIKLGQQVKIQFDAFMDSSYTGKITSISAGGGDRKSWGNGLYYQVIIEFNGQKKDKLLVGMSAVVEIETGVEHAK